MARRSTRLHLDTDEAIEALACPRGKQQAFYRDAAVSGLGMRVTSGGRRAWVFRFSLDGRDHRMSLGAYPELSPTDAQQLAAEKRAQVRRGEDPRQEQLVPDADARTLGALWKQLEEKHLPRRSAGHQRNLRHAWQKNILPALGASTPVATLSWEQVSDWHAGMADTPTHANRCLAALRVALNLARKWGWIERGAVNPAADHERHFERKAGRPYTPSQMTAIGEATRAEEDPVIRAALEVYFLTGLRPDEVCTLRWDWIREGGILCLEETKTGDRVAVLPTPAEARIRSLPRAGEWVFPGRTPGSHLGGVGRSHGLANAWKRIRQQAELDEGVRLYDGRHTWASTAGALDIGDDIRRVLTGHAAAPGSAHGAYLHATPLYREKADLVAETLAVSYTFQASQAP